MNVVWMPPCNEPCHQTACSSMKNERFCRPQPSVCRTLDLTKARRNKSEVTSCKVRKSAQTMAAGPSGRHTVGTAECYHKLNLRVTGGVHGL